MLTITLATGIGRTEEGPGIPRGVRADCGMSSQLPIWFAAHVPADTPATVPTVATSRGIAFLASEIGRSVPTDEMVDFVSACHLNLVVIDFAWITYHWPRADMASIRDACNRLQKDGVRVAAMYRPRLLSPGEAAVHCAQSDDGKIEKSHNDLCFAHEDSVAWAVKWGIQIRSALPAVDSIILYNIRTPCRCPNCRKQEGKKQVTRFLNRCRSNWRKTGPSLQIGHVGLADEYVDAVDFYCPFLNVNRTEDSPPDFRKDVSQLVRLSSTHPNKPMTPLLKVCWDNQTRNTSEDIISAIKECETAKTGFILWHYDWIFRSADQRYDRRTIAESLGGNRTKIHRLFREDARTAMKIQAGRATSSSVPNIQSTIATSENEPLLAFPKVPASGRQLPWPHQPPSLKATDLETLNRDVWVINDFSLYQADDKGDSSYLHCGLDIVLKNGTKIYAIQDGWVKSTAHSTVTVADNRGSKPSYGWEYTHLSQLQVEVDEFVRQGTYIGQVEFTGLPHIHLSRVYSQENHWGEWRYLVMPNEHFTYEDTQPPVIKKPFYFFQNNRDTPIESDPANKPVLSGKVDIVVPMRDEGEFAHSRETGFGDRLGLTRIEYRVRPIDQKGTKSLKFRSFDFEHMAVKSGAQSRSFNTIMARTVCKHWRVFEPERSNWDKVFNYYVITNCPQSGEHRELKPEWADACWDTAAVNRNHNPVFPDGEYEIKVQAWDMKGNQATETMTVAVANHTQRRVRPSRGD